MTISWSALNKNLQIIAELLYTAALEMGKLTILITRHE